MLAGMRDLHNVARYGTSGPRFAERVWVDPRTVSRVVRDSRFRRPQSARVMPGDWDLHAESIDSWEKFVAWERHWKYGVTWEATGRIESVVLRIAAEGAIDGMKNASDVIRRYDELDSIYASVRESGRLLSVREVGGDSFRGWGDILVHVGRGPELLLGRGGQHRFAMARHLGLDLVPAQLGAIHPAVIDSWAQCCIRSSERPHPRCGNG